jgi:DNA invertase Pin-like site-specific DNA recombinase
LIAAIYARKSTEQTVADEQKSVTRQIAHARAYAERKGWTVVDAHVYVDDGISGAEFANRPGYMRLMNALAPRPPFQILIMAEGSRLGREAWETGYALKRLLSADVRVFFYLEDRECSFEHSTGKLLFSMLQAFDEMERARASQRVTDAMERKARAGHVTGGRVFGYDNVDIVGPSGERSHVERRINDAEAAVVRRIFALAVDGVGQKRIAQRLNAEGAAAPRAQQGRPHGWAQSSVHEVLFRPLYKGEIVWNRTRKRNRWGATRVADRPPSEWLYIPAPALRIVPEDLWQAAHARIADARQLYYDRTKGLRGGRPRIDSKYLLPGLATCTCCSGGLLVRTDSSGSGANRRRAFFYGCSSYFNRGPAVCANRVQVPMHLIDEAVLGAIGDILTPDLVEDVIARVREMVEPRRDDEPRARVARELAGQTFGWHGSRRRLRMVPARSLSSSTSCRRRTGRGRRSPRSYSRGGKVPPSLVSIGARWSAARGRCWRSGAVS